MRSVTIVWFVLRIRTAWRGNRWESTTLRGGRCSTMWCGALVSDYGRAARRGATCKAIKINREGRNTKRLLREPWLEPRRRACRACLVQFVIVSLMPMECLEKCKMCISLSTNELVETARVQRSRVLLTPGVEGPMNCQALGLFTTKSQDVTPYISRKFPRYWAFRRQAT